MFLKWCLHFVSESWPLSVPCRAVGVCVSERPGGLAAGFARPALVWVWLRRLAPQWGRPVVGLSYGTDSCIGLLYISPRVLGSRTPYKGDDLLLNLRFSTFDLGQKMQPASSHRLCGVSAALVGALSCPPRGQCPRRPGQPCAHHVRARLLAKLFLC